MLDLDDLNLEFLENLLGREFLPGFTGITRPAVGICKGSCIDSIYIKTNDLATEIYKLIDSLTDHYSLFTAIDKIQLKIKKPTVTINYNKLKNIASIKNWSEILSMQAPNRATDVLIDKIKECIVSAKIVLKTNNKQKKVWITKEMYYTMWQSDCNNKLLESQYKNLKQILDKVILDTKIKYDRNLVLNNMFNPKKLWEIINVKVRRKTNINNHIDYIKVDNNKITNKTVIANVMNDYFCEVGEKLSEKINVTDFTLPRENVTCKSLFVKPTNITEITNVINALKPKSGGVDRIHAKVLKMICHHVAEPLTYIINKCISLSIWPDSLKKS